VKFYLLRHVIAANAEDTGSEGDRPLTDKGSKRMRKAARGLRRLGIKFDAILTSPMARAHETAAIIAEALSREAHLSVVEALRSDSSIDALLLSLKDYQLRKSAMVGHEPLLSDTASFLLTGKKTSSVKIALTKGGLCHIEIDSLPPSNPGVLALLLAPKILRRLGTPK